MEGLEPQAKEFKIFLRSPGTHSGFNQVNHEIKLVLLEDNSGSDSLNRLQRGEKVCLLPLCLGHPSLFSHSQPSCLCPMRVQNPDLRTVAVSTFPSPALQPSDTDHGGHSNVPFDASTNCWMFQLALNS